MRASRTFAPNPECVRAARRFAAKVLEDLPPGAFEPIELMVSELATNCIKHGGTAFELTITQRPGEVRIEVCDTGAGIPTVRSPRPEDPSGRGLQIVGMLSDDWGIETADSTGKTVWLTVSTRPQAGETASTSAR